METRKREVLVAAIVLLVLIALGIYLYSQPSWLVNLKNMAGRQQQAVEPPKLSEQPSGEQPLSGPPVQQAAYGIKITKYGAGYGIVSSVPAGIECGNDCYDEFLNGTMLTFYASAAANSAFVGWSGACFGIEPRCTFPVNSAKEVAATFELTAIHPEPPESASDGEYRLSINLLGSGTGAVVSSPRGINCGGDCSQRYAADTSVTLTAIPTAGSSFFGWSGACSGRNDQCTVTMRRARSVTANFAGVGVVPPGATNRLSVSLFGVGFGLVSSVPAGISCGADCAEDYASGSAVTLTASPAAGSTFAGWGGACAAAGAAPCTIILDADKSVTAKFSTPAVPVPRHRLSVVKSGSGTVDSRIPAGSIQCGPDCAEDLDEGTPVRLSAMPADGWILDNLFGCDSIEDEGFTCVLSMTSDRTVTAKFKKTYQLLVRREGAGAGVVRSEDMEGGRIDCGAFCLWNYPEGSDLVLGAFPAAGSHFVEWTGCDAVGPGADPLCVIRIRSDRTIFAKFEVG